MATTNQVIRREADSTIFSEVTVASVNRIFATVTRSAGTVATWIRTAIQSYGPCAGSSQTQVVGIDVACQPGGDIALLQLSVRDCCLIYQLQHNNADPPAEFLAFLDDPRCCFFGHDVEMIADRLQRHYGFLVRHTADLRVTAAARQGQEDLRRAGLERLVRELMQLEIEMLDEVQLSAWWQPELSDEQIAYACADAVIASSSRGCS